MLNGREGSSVRRRLFLVKGQLSIAADYLIWSHINRPPENIWDT